MILGIDTCTKFCSVALMKEGTIYSEIDRNTFGHAESLMPMIDRILLKHQVKPTEIEKIVISLGPGSFTGIRIGISTALGLASAIDCEVYGVSSLEARSRFSVEGSRCVLIDARRNRVYAAVYGEKPLEECNISFPDLLEKLPEECSFSGEEIAPFLEQVSRSFLEIPFYDYAKGAIECYLDGHYTSSIVPHYLREAQAEAERKGHPTD